MIYGGLHAAPKVALMLGSSWMPTPNSLQRSALGSLWIKQSHYPSEYELPAPRCMSPHAVDGRRADCLFGQ
jgi:hypothetical protein